MQALVIYESMYGNTHLIADAVATGLSEGGTDATVVAVGDAEPDHVAAADLVVVGGPTHAHGMSRKTTRQSAIADVEKADGDLELDPDAEGEGLRDWFDELPPTGGHAAAFDTRIHMAGALTGRASKGIGKRLRRHGFALVDEPTSFFVQKDNHLEADEQTRAREWGRALAQAIGADAKQTSAADG